MSSSKKKDEVKKRRSAAAGKKASSPGTPTGKARRKSSSASRSAFPSAEMSTHMLRQKITEYETQIKSLTRDNKVLARKIEKMESAQKGKDKKMNSEQEMRLKANKERYWLRQKLERLVPMVKS